MIFLRRHSYNANLQVFLSDMHLRSLLEPQDALFTDKDFLKIFKQRELSTENTADGCRAATSADMLRSHPAYTAQMNADDPDASKSFGMQMVYS
jgi:hypothetical protein